MKNVLELKNYKTKFKKYYGVEYNSKKYDIHHIDLNHNNNDIDNLMLLPKELHQRYHFYRNNINTKEIMPDFLISGTFNNPNRHFIFCMEGLLPVLAECQKWYDYKLYLDGLVPNIHNIELEK